MQIIEKKLCACFLVFKAICVEESCRNVCLFDETTFHTFHCLLLLFQNIKINCVCSFEVFLSNFHHHHHQHLNKLAKLLFVACLSFVVVVCLLWPRNYHYHFSHSLWFIYSIHHHHHWWIESDLIHCIFIAVVVWLNRIHFFKNRMCII